MLPSAWTRWGCAPAPARPARSPPGGSSRSRRPPRRPRPARAPRSSGAERFGRSESRRGPFAQLRRRLPAAARSPRPRRADRRYSRPPDELRRHRSRSGTIETHHPEREEPVMPEAVIVSTARSPIGRAVKGSLVEHPPGRPRHPDRARRAGQGAGAGPARHRRPDDGLRPARRRVRLQHRPHRRGAARLRLPARHDRQPLLLVVAADLPDGVPRDQGRRGSMRSSRPASRRCRGSPTAAPTAGRTRTTSAYAEAEQRTAKVAESGAAEWHDPREDGLLPDVYIAMGQTAENLALLQERQPRGHGPLRRPLAEPRRGRRIANGFWARDITPDHAAGRHRRVEGRRPAGRGHLRGRLRASSRCSGRTAGSPPATAARSTTARPRSSS